MGIKLFSLNIVCIYDYDKLDEYLLDNVVSLWLKELYSEKTRLIFIRLPFGWFLGKKLRLF